MRRFGVFFLSHTAPRFQLWFYFHLCIGVSTGVCSWGCPGGPGFAPVRCGGDAAAWVSGALAAPGTQGGWRLGQQEIQCSRRAWQPVLANTLQYSCWRSPPSVTEKTGRPVYRVTKSQTRLKWPCVHRHRLFCLWQLCPSEGWVWRWHSCLACGDPGRTTCAGTRSASTAGNVARVFYRASCSWQSEGLFGKSFSIAPPIKELRGLPCLGSFSAVWHIRHIEGSPWLGSYSGVQCIRRLMGQRLYCSAADAGM